MLTNTGVAKKPHYRRLRLINLLRLIRFVDKVYGCAVMIFRHLKNLRYLLAELLTVTKNLIARRVDPRSFGDSSPGS